MTRKLKTSKQGTSGASCESNQLFKNKKIVNIEISFSVPIPYSIAIGYELVTYKKIIRKNKLKIVYD